MDNEIHFLIGICIIEVIVITIIAWYYFKKTPSTYNNKSKKRNEVDEEIENELKNNK